MTVEQAWQPHPYGFILIGAGLCALLFAFLVGRGRRAPGAGLFVLLQITLAVWLFGYALELFAVAPAAKVMWTRLSYVGLALSGPLPLAFLLSFSGRTRRQGAWTTPLLLLVPMLTIVVMMFRPAWMWQSYEIATDRYYSYYITTRFGPWFTSVHTPYAYLVFLAAMALIFDIALRSPRLVRSQSAALFSAGIVALGVNIFYLLLNRRLNLPVDLTPIVLSLTSWLVGWVTLYFGVLDWSPLAREAIVTHLPVAVFLLDHLDQVAEVNPRGRELIADTAQTPVGRPVSELLPAGWWPTLEPAIRSAPAALELTRRVNGQELAYRVNVEPVIDRSARRIGALMILEDITERRRAQAELFAGRQRLQSVMSAAPMVLATVDRAGKITLAGGAQLAELGLQAAELPGQPLSALFGADDQLADSARRALDGEEFAALMELNDGSYEISLRPERNAAGAIDGAILVALNVTDRIHAEQAMRETQRLESLAMLAGGIAHDFNNLLTAIMSHTAVAQLKLNNPTAAASHLDRALESAERASDLTRQLLAYAGKGQFRLETIDLARILVDDRDQLRTLTNDRLVLPDQLDAAPLTLRGDRGQVQQVLRNLVRNAVESMPAEGGVVTIAAGHEMLLPEAVAATQWVGETPKPGPAVYLRVTDTGVGMSADTLKRIFDPFYSTKALGSGLGLSATLGIIRIHGGGLQVRSEEGQGSEFTVWFPAAIGSSPTGSTTGTVHKHRTRPITVLVVDDEESVRVGLCAMLELYEFNSIEAATPNAALEIFEARRQEIDVVLADMQMPEMNGLELLRRIRAISPDVRMLLSSGYTQMQISDEFATENIHVFLQKPYRIEKLVTAIESALASPPGGASAAKL